MYGSGVFFFLSGLLAKQLSKTATTGKTGEAASALARHFISTLQLLNLVPLGRRGEVTGHLFCHSKPCNGSAEMSHLDPGVDREYILPGPQRGLGHTTLPAPVQDVLHFPLSLLSPGTAAGSHEEQPRASSPGGALGKNEQTSANPRSQPRYKDHEKRCCA